MSETVEFENLEKYKGANSDGLERTIFHLMGRGNNNIDCGIAIDHVEHDVTIYNETGRSDPDFQREMREYFLKQCGGSADKSYHIAGIQRYSKLDAISSIEGLIDPRYKIIALRAEYKTTK